MYLISIDEDGVKHGSPVKPNSNVYAASNSNIEFKKHIDEPGIIQDYDVNGAPIYFGIQKPESFREIMLENILNPENVGKSFEALSKQAMDKVNRAEVTPKIHGAAWAAL